MMWQRGLAGVTGLLMAANGVVMFVAGEAWYSAVPGVTSTGPYNAHFVQDIGLAYLVAGGGLVAGALRSPWRPAAVAAALFLAAHALLHLHGSLTGHHAAAELSRDFMGVYLPPLLAALALTPFRRTA